MEGCFCSYMSCKFLHTTTSSLSDKMVALLILTCAINDEEEGEEEEDEEEIDDEFKEDESVIEKINICSLELVVNKAIGLVNKSPK